MALYLLHFRPEQCHPHYYQFCSFREDVVASKSRLSPRGTHDLHVGA